MYQDYIKHVFKTIGVTLCCMLLLGIVSFYIFGDDIGEQAGQQHLSSNPKDTQNKAQYPEKNMGQNPGPHSNANANQNSSSNAQVGLPNSQAQNERFQEGKHYQKLSAKVTTQPVVQQLVALDPGKIQVIEFFNYACFWCQRLHPRVNEWEKTKPDYIALHRFPIVFNKSWEVMAKAYLIVQILNENKDLDPKFFQAIHTDNQDLSDEKLLQEFFVKNGVDQSKFLEMYGSFAVSRALAHSTELINAYQLIVSPAIVVNGPSGSYLVTASTAGSEAAILDVVNFLLEKESKVLGR